MPDENISLEEIAAKLLILERRAHELADEVHVLFQDVLDTLHRSGVE